MGCEDCKNYKPKKEPLAFQSEFDLVTKTNVFGCGSQECDNCAFYINGSCVSEKIRCLLEGEQV